VTTERETIAIYSEYPIRTYGFSVRTGLTLLALPPEIDPLALEEFLEQPPSLEAPLVLGAGIGAPDGALLLNLVVDLPDPATARLRLPSDAHIVPDVESVTFQGPHYGDRYGIAAAAFDALGRANVPLLAAGLAGASVCLVVPSGCGGAAVSAMRASFYVPGEESNSRAERESAPGAS